jgi:hypothetical protein
MSKAPREKVVRILRASCVNKQKTGFEIAIINKKNEKCASVLISTLLKLHALDSTMVSEQHITKILRPYSDEKLVVNDETQKRCLTLCKQLILDSDLSFRCKDKIISNWEIRFRFF